MKALHETAEKISWLDLFVSQALLAHEKKYTKPLFVKNEALKIIEGRHPVIEEFLPRDQQFIPNDLKLNSECRVQSSE
jgi:DNA mismatch repair protein MutS